MYPTVPNRRKDMPCLKLSIHAPGRGSLETRLGKAESSRNGLARPMPIMVKSSIAWAAGSLTA